jgi:hypothetical protein
MKAKLSFLFLFVPLQSFFVTDGPSVRLQPAGRRALGLFPDCLDDYYVPSSSTVGSVRSGWRATAKMVASHICSHERAGLGDRLLLLVGLVNRWRTSRARG